MRSDDAQVKVDLSALRSAGDEPPLDPRREAALLAAFDAARLAPRTPHPAPRTSISVAYFAAAATIVLAAGASLYVENRAPRVDRGAPLLAAHTAESVAAPITASAPTTNVRSIEAPGTARSTRAPQHEARSVFVPWPGAETLPAFESGQLVRMDLPTPMAISLGLTPRASNVPSVRADVVIGQDGLARAVRIAPAP